MTRATLILATVALAACGRPDVVAEDANTAALPEPVNATSASADGAPPAEGSSPGTSMPAAVATIPAALHGRWGLTPGDCTSTRGDAKGLLIVSADGLRFYESRAVPAAGVQTDVDSISGDFAFTGEGQEWTRHETLELQNDKLVRTERDPLGTFTYVRC